MALMIIYDLKCVIAGSNDIITWLGLSSFATRRFFFMSLPDLLDLGDDRLAVSHDLSC